MRLALFSYWANTYFGGAVAAIGGALVLGARCRESGGTNACVTPQSWPWAWPCWLTPGPTRFVLLHSCRGRSAGVDVSEEESSAAVLHAAGGTAFELVGWRLLQRHRFYFWRVTGSPFRIPYQVNIATYHLVYFPWQKLGPPANTTMK
jgi:hypothetical protein